MGDNWTSVPELLSRLEDLELPRLAWGIVDVSLSRQDVESSINDQVVADIKAKLSPAPTTSEYLDHLIDNGLLHRVPGSRPESYRTRMAEYIRLLRELRQLFPPTDATANLWWRSGASLVSDYRLRVSPRYYPRRTLPVSEVATFLESVSKKWTPTAESVTRAILGDRQAANFQLAASQAILQALERQKEAGFIVTAGTGSGKTLAFYLPAFIDLSRKLGQPTQSVHTLALYPRSELLRDQARECLRMALKVNRDPANKGLRPIRIGVLYGSTPQNAETVTNTRLNNRFSNSWRNVGGAYVCPYFSCPEEGCDGKLAWHPADHVGDQETLRCLECERTTPPKMLALTRDSMIDEPPDILFSSTEMLSRQSTDKKLGQLLGWSGKSKPHLVLLDEAHTYSGVHGAQVALTLRRWRRAVRGSNGSVFVGLSATLKNPEGFFSRLTGIQEGYVEGITPSPGELERIGREYTLVVRGDPVSGASLLSTTIQTAMLSGRILDRQPGLFGSSLFLFTDDLDVTNRIFDDLRDAEGSPGFRGSNRTGTPLAEIRSPVAPQAQRRYVDGQSWELPNQLGRLGLPLIVSRTSSQDSGVDIDADVVVATGSLEVGFNDPRVGLVIQHKAPHDSASFIQRRGRAGRTRDMRPITIVVLSDYGRDRVTYQTYEQLLSPDVDSRNIPIGNRYVLKIQGANALLDWVAQRTGANVRAALTKEPPTEKGIAAKVSDFLSRLQQDGTLQNKLAAHLKHSLGITDNEALAVMWDEPRSLLLSVVPTALRRLESEWKVASKNDSDPGEDSKTPLPEFITTALFEPLNIPDVGLALPPIFNKDPERMEILLALREAVPGRVSHRFGYSQQDRRTWLPLPDNGPLDLAQIITRGQRQGVWTGQDGRQFFVVRPLQLQLQEPPQDVVESSNSQPRWDSEFVFSHSRPVEMDIPSPSPWASWVRSAEFFTHSTGSQVCIRRMTWGATCELAKNRGGRTIRTTVPVEYVFDGQPAALGFDGTHDALVIRAQVPDDCDGALSSLSASPAWRTVAFRQRIAEDHRLDGVANSFQRMWLANLYLHAFVVAGFSSRDPDIAATASANGQWTNHLGDYMLVIYRRDNPQAGGTTRVQDALRNIIADPSVQTVVEEHARLLIEPNVFTETSDLIRRSIADTLADAVTAASRGLLADSGDIDLTADVLWEPDLSSFNVVLSESSIGGLGLMEQLMTQYSRNPRAFWEKVATVIGPSEYEEVDRVLRAAISLVVSQDNALAAATDRLRNARHAADAEQALDSFLDHWTSKLGPPNHLEVATFATRLLRPGADQQTSELTEALLQEWDQLEADLGVEVDVRSLAFLVARGHLQWSANQLNADTVESMLWLRGSRARAQQLQSWNPFRSDQVVERLVLECLVSRDFPQVDVTEPDWEDAYRSLLQVHGELELTAPSQEREAMAQAVAICAALPVERGSLRVYGRILSCSQRLGETRTRVAITEEYQ